jgi:hypothetical protein
VRHASQVAAAELFLRRGLLTPYLLRSVGISRDAAERAVKAGLWSRPVRGHYVPHARSLTPLELARGAAAYVGSPCVVTGLLALSRHRVPWLPEIAGAHVLVADSVRTVSAGPYHVQRTPQWNALPTESAGGLQWAPPERAVIDAARTARSLREARGLVLGVVGAGLATPADLSAVLATTRRNGSGFARRAVRDAERGCASPPEAELVDALLPLRVPFLVNPEIWVDGVHLGNSDVWILGTAVGGEVESRQWHEGAEAEESTYDRHERFVAAGLDLVHLGVRRMRSDLPAAARYLVQRAQAGPPLPPGLVVVPRGPLLGG